VTAGLRAGISQFNQKEDGMTDKHTVEVWLVIDSSGDYDTGPDRDSAIDAFDNNIGGGGARRIIKLIKLTFPAEEDEAEVDVSDTAGETTTAEAV
jgi:hypothetical protein